MLFSIFEQISSHLGLLPFPTITMLILKIMNNEKLPPLLVIFFTKMRQKLIEFETVKL